MARVKMSSLVSQISGKSNGSQFVNTQYGLCLFNKAQQRRFPHAKQLGQRQVFRYLSSLWGALSDAERDANNANALNYPLIDNFGNTYYLTGYALLLRSNLNLYKASLPLIAVVPATPPTVFDVNDAVFTLENVTPVIRRIRLVYSTTVPDFSDYVFLADVSPPVSPGIINYNGVTAVTKPTSQSSTLVLMAISNVPYRSSWKSGLRVFVTYRVISKLTGTVAGVYTFSAIVP